MQYKGKSYLESLDESIICMNSIIKEVVKWLEKTKN